MISALTGNPPLGISDQFLADLVNQGVAAALFSSRHPKNFENEKIFLCLKIAEIDMGGQFLVEKDDSAHKKLILFKGKLILRR